MLIVWLDQCADHPLALVGGKAARLADGVDGATVPPGFCLTTIAYDQWRIWQDAPAAPTQPLPPVLEEALAGAYRRLTTLCGPEAPPVAVRSSAVDEDSPGASFAGQYQTFLNVTGVNAIAVAVAKCWSAMVDPQVIAYRCQQGLAEHSKAAVIVQQLVDADVSAVAFGANPITGATTEVVINAAWGLGESLVGGQITPDAYIVNKSNQAVIGREIARKAQMTMRAGQGVTLAPVPTARQTSPTLTDPQIAAIARLASALELRYGWPVDIECAYADQCLYLLQCRPITSLPAPARVKPQPNVAQNTAAAEAWEVTWDMAEDAGHSWAGGKDLVKPLQQSLSLYYYQGWAKAFHGVKARGGLHARFVHGYEYRRWRFEPLHSWEETSAAQQAAAHELPTRWRTEWLPAIQEDLARWRTVNLVALRNDELAVHLHNMLNRQLHHWEIHAYMGSVPLETVQRLVDWYLERFPTAPESEPYILLQGQPNVSMESNHHL
jgi:pyruvate,water dikinase